MKNGKGTESRAVVHSAIRTLPPPRLRRAAIASATAAPRSALRLIGGLMILALVAPLAGDALRSTSEPGGLSPALWDATIAVESGGDPAAYNVSSGAAGVAQIRPICLADCNRIARLQGLDLEFAMSDRWDPARSRLMWAVYLVYYGERYAEDTGEPATDEVYARIWKGGPAGWRKASTSGYWDRVRAAME